MKKMIIILSLVLLTGCRTVKYVPMETVRTDTVYQKQVERDSIMLHDSVYIREWMRGDTVYVDRTRWRTEYRDRYLCDTVYESSTDSVAVPYPVEKELTKWQHFCLDYGKMTTGATVLLVILGGAWAVRRLT